MRVNVSRSSQSSSAISPCSYFLSSVSNFPKSPQRIDDVVSSEEVSWTTAPLCARSRNMRWFPRRSDWCSSKRWNVASATTTRRRMFRASQTLISSRAPADRSLYFKGKNRVSDQITAPSSYTAAAVLVAVVRGSSAG
jgi:hypothetical protein